jgi:hypothetical protein
MRRFRVLLAAAAIVSSAASASAQAPGPEPPSPAALQAAKGLVALIARPVTAEMTADVTARVWPQVETAMRAQYPKIDGATLGELRSRYEKLMSDTVADAMREAPAVYARYFTAAEMDDIAAFYRTPTGAKALTIMPKAMADMMPGLLVRFQSTKGKLAQAFNNILKQHGYEAK